MRKDGALPDVWSSASRATGRITFDRVACCSAVNAASNPASAKCVNRPTTLDPAARRRTRRPAPPPPPGNAEAMEPRGNLHVRSRLDCGRTCGSAQQLHGLDIEHAHIQHNLKQRGHDGSTAPRPRTRIRAATPAPRSASASCGVYAPSHVAPPSRAARARRRARAPYPLRRASPSPSPAPAGPSRRGTFFSERVNFELGPAQQVGGDARRSARRPAPARSAAAAIREADPPHTRPNRGLLAGAGRGVVGDHGEDRVPAPTRSRRAPRRPCRWRQ